MKRLIKKSYVNIVVETFKSMSDNANLYNKLIDDSREYAKNGFEFDPETTSHEMFSEVSEKLVENFDSLVESIIDDIVADAESNGKEVNEKDYEEMFYGCSEEDKEEVVYFLINKYSDDINELIEAEEEDAQAMYLGR